MIVRSLGYRTDLIFAAYDGVITDRGDHLVIRSPLNPTFYWGNFLLFERPPAPGDLERWQALFAREIGVPPEVGHQTFGWDTTDGEAGVIEPFLEAGFRVNRSVVLTAREPRLPARPTQGYEMRPLESDDDWAQAIENQVLMREPEHEEAGYRLFCERRMARYRAMAGDGLGAWYGAFFDGRLVGDMGLFHDGEVARYQAVQTHPEHRRRGVAGTLVVEAARHARAAFGVRRLVIVADQGEPAERLYRSVGFRAREAQIGLERW